MEPRHNDDLDQLTEGHLSLLSPDGDGVRLPVWRDASRPWRNASRICSAG